MNQSDLLLLVIVLILLSSLTVFVVQFLRSRRRGDGSEGDGRAGWWEGPWDEDRR